VRGGSVQEALPPALNDEVWRLDRIGKDGAFHKRLNQAGIFTVEDFLRLVVMDPQKLRNVSPPHRTTPPPVPACLYPPASTPGGSQMQRAALEVGVWQCALG